MGRNMENIFSVIMKQINSFNKENLVIAVDGRCAAGKTTLAGMIQKETGCNVIHMDHFFLQPGQRTKERLDEPGGNVDYERMRKEVLIPLSQRQAFAYQPFDCKSMELTGEIKIEPASLAIIEGSYSCHPVLWDFYDLRVFLDIDSEEQIRRIRRRNGTEAVSVFRDRWIPLEEWYFSVYSIQERCSMVFNNKFV